MYRHDEAALLCDLAEVYHIYSPQAVPLTMLATYACGLRSDSRIVMSLNGSAASFPDMLLAGIYDRLGLLLWAQTEDGIKGRNRPNSIMQELQGIKEEKETLYESGADFMAARAKLIKTIKEGERWQHR